MESVVLEVVGEKVKVAPSVVVVTGVVIPVGTITVFVPNTMVPEFEVTGRPSGRVVVKGGVSNVLLLEVTELVVEAVLDGKNVKVKPSVVVVTGVDIPVGTTMVCYGAEN